MRASGAVEEGPWQVGQSAGLSHLEHNGCVCVCVIGSRYEYLRPGDSPELQAKRWHWCNPCPPHHTGWSISLPQWPVGRSVFWPVSCSTGSAWGLP